MKKVLIFLIYTIAPIFSNAQSPIEGYQIGYWYDINKNLIDGYYDIEYTPEKSFSVSYTTGDQFTPGYYYNLEGEKIEGYLKYNINSTSFQFSFTKNGEQKKVKPTECKGYVIGKDSFAVVPYVEIPKKLVSQFITTPEFVEVLDQFENLIFYKHTYAGAQNSSITYIVKNTTTPEYISFPKSKTKFISTATPYFKDFDALVNGIMLEKFQEEDIPMLIKMLKYKKCFDNNSKIFFDSNWNEENDSTDHFYYAKVNSIKDTIINVTYYTKKGDKVYEGDFTSFYPHKKTGDVLFFHANGTLRKKTKTEYNITLGEIYHHNGNIRLKYRNYDMGTRYLQVCDTNGVNLLDLKGNATERFFDSIQSRLIISEYKAFQLSNAYYIDLLGRKVYLCSEKNASIKGFKYETNTFTNSFKYPESSIKNGNQGTALVSCIIEPTGLVSEIKIIRGIDSLINEEILILLSKMKLTPLWKVEKIDDEKIVQQILLPIEFKIFGFSWYRNNGGNYWMHHQNQMMMNNSIPTQHIPVRPPSGF